MDMRYSPTLAEWCNLVFYVAYCQIAHSPFSSSWVHAQERRKRAKKEIKHFYLKLTRFTFSMSHMHVLNLSHLRYPETSLTLHRNYSTACKHHLALYATYTWLEDKLIAIAKVIQVISHTSTKNCSLSDNREKWTLQAG